MDLITLLFVVLFLAVIGVLIRYFFFSQPKKIGARGAEIKALNHILAGEKKQALQQLSEKRFYLQENKYFSESLNLNNYYLLTPLNLKKHPFLV